MCKNSKENILSFLENQTNKYNNRIALGMRNDYGWSEFTYNGLSSLSKNIASYLIDELKVKRQEHIAIISESKIEFGAAFFASVIAGTTFIPLDIKLTIHEITSIMSNCNPTTLFISNKYLHLVDKIKEEIPSLKNIILLDDNHKESRYISIYNMPSAKVRPFRHRNLDSNALIIYTSGTTGKPKGVQTTFRNLLSQIKDLQFELGHIFKKDEKINTLSILPMNHLFELTVGFATFLSMGYSIYYTKSLRPKDVLGVMKDKKIKFMCTVPSFFKMLKIQFESELNKQSNFKKMIYNLKYHYIAKFLPFRALKKRLFKDIHSAFGNNFYGFISGGAPMDVEMGKYFNRIGINVFQGYGLSEASPVVAFNLTDKNNLKTVGRPLKSFKVKIDSSTKELLVKGPAVMKGYYLQEDLTKEVIDEDGWLHTGDIAKIDNKNQVFITGRIKNMIVLSGGKKVFPEEVEAVIEQSEFVKEVCVLSNLKKTGEKKGTEEVCAVVCPKAELYENYDDTTVENITLVDIKKKLLKLTQYKRPSNIIISKEELPKTATRKIKRKEVIELISAK